MNENKSYPVPEDNDGFPSITVSQASAKNQRFGKALNHLVRHKNFVAQGNRATFYDYTWVPLLGILLVIGIIGFTSFIQNNVDPEFLMVTLIVLLSGVTVFAVFGVGYLFGELFNPFGYREDHKNIYYDFKAYKLQKRVDKYFVESSLEIPEEAVPYLPYSLEDIINDYKKVSNKNDDKSTTGFNRIMSVVNQAKHDAKATKEKIDTDMSTFNDCEVDEILDKYNASVLRAL